MPVTITIDSNYDTISKGINATLKEIIDNSDPILIAAASGALSLVSERIHIQGKRANGAAIGQYSNSYLKVREANGRGGDRNIILSFTRQMELDFTVVAVAGSVGLGFNNSTNFQKATWLEQRYPDTYNLSTQEEEEVVLIIEDYINGLFK